MSFRVLLISEDPKETELYSELIRELVDCQIDRMSHFDWSGRIIYHLVVIDSSQEALMSLERVKRFSPATSVILI